MPGLVVRLPKALRISFDLWLLRTSLSPNANIAGQLALRDAERDVMGDAVEDRREQGRKGLRLM